MVFAVDSLTSKAVGLGYKIRFVGTELPHLLQSRRNGDSAKGTFALGIGRNLLGRTMELFVGMKSIARRLAKQSECIWGTVGG